MSTHLMTVAAHLAIDPTEKLALLCMAENANMRDRVAFPGLEELMSWTGCKRSQVFNLIAALKELRLIEQQERGRRGRRASYLVFPAGCCTQHGLEPDDLDLPEEDFASTVTGRNQQSEGPGTVDPVLTCGLSDPLDANGRKGSSETRERVQSHAQAKGPLHLDPPQELPPLQAPPVVTHQQPLTSELLADCIHDSRVHLCPICKHSAMRVAS